MSRPKRAGRPGDALTFHCPADLRDWLKALAAAAPDRPELTLSQAAVWVLQLGREYSEAFPADLRAQAEAMAKERGMTRAQLVARAIASGLLVLEQEGPRVAVPPRMEDIQNQPAWAVVPPRPED